MTISGLRSLALPVAIACGSLASYSTLATSQVPISATSSAITSGMRVRVVAPEYGDAAQTGTVVARNGDYLVLHRDAGGPDLSLPIQHITRLAVSLGRHSHAVTGLGIGLASGLAVGALGGLGGAASTACTPGGCYVTSSKGRNAAIGVAVGGGLGAVIGLLTGSAIRTERWQTSRLGGLPSGLSIMPSQTGSRMALQIAVRF